MEILPGFVDQPAEPGNTDYPTVATVCVWLWFRGFKTQATMRTFLVVVRDVLSQESFEVAFAEDEDAVQTLPSCGLHETLGKSVCLG